MGVLAVYPWVPSVSGSLKRTWDAQRLGPMSSGRAVTALKNQDITSVPLWSFYTQIQVSLPERTQSVISSPVLIKERL